MNPFVDGLATTPGLRDLDVAILRAADVHGAEELHSLLVAFPGLADAGVDVPLISSLAARQVVPAYRAALAAPAAPPPRVELGALPPPQAQHAPGYTVPVPALTTTGPAPASPVVGGTAIDHRVAGWPVRDQAHRGTCVAFGLAACVEQSRGGRDLSEQFLYWAIKDHHDPNTHQDGTWLHFAAAALHHDGVCAEQDWPYNPNAVPGHKGDPPPSPGAAAAAAATRPPATHVPTGNAATVYAMPRTRPVAISLPVFGSQQSTLTNWTSPIGRQFGRVLNPPATAVVVGGHCVCLTGFHPDPAEPAGGWFIIRNSWGQSVFGAAGAPGNPLCPERGYGAVSATYVDTYTWEWCHL